MMHFYELASMNPAQRARLLRRAESQIDELIEYVRPIVQAVRERGDEALLEFTARFDRVQLTADRLRISREEIERAYQVLDTSVRAAIEHAITDLSLAQAVLAYRDEYLMEYDFGRLEGHPLSLSPMYIQRDDHATGLVRLLSLALRVLTLLEFVVRSRLAQQDTLLTGLYAGNPKRATSCPTTERLLEGFQHITLTILVEPHQTRRHLTPLSPLQQRTLALLDFSPQIYLLLCGDSSVPP